MFSKEAALFYIPTDSVYSFRFLHILVNTCYYLTLIIAILVDMNWYLIVIFISLGDNDVENLFMCSLDISVSSLEKYLFTSFSHYLYF